MKTDISPDIDVQRAYYDERWATERYADLLQLQRGIGILNGLRMVNLRSPKILDLGCGTGWLSGMLGCFGPTTGVDLSPAAIEKARMRFPDVQFIVSDFSDRHIYTRDTRDFDVVVSQEVIEHVVNQAEHLDLIASLLRPGGYLILSTPNAWNFAHWDKEKIQEWGLQPIENWLTRKQLRDLLKPKYRIINLRTIMVGYGTRGIFRLASSPKLASILKACSLSSFYNLALEQIGFGLHIVVVAVRL